MIGGSVRCSLGTRTVEPHMIGLRPFGLDVEATTNYYDAKATPKTGERGDNPLHTTYGTDDDPTRWQRCAGTQGNIEIALTNKPIRAHLHTGVLPQQHRATHHNRHGDRISRMLLLPDLIRMHRNRAHCPYRRTRVADLRPTPQQIPSLTSSDSAYASLQS